MGWGCGKVFLSALGVPLPCVLSLIFCSILDCFLCSMLWHVSHLVWVQYILTTKGTHCGQGGFNRAIQSEFLYDLWLAYYNRDVLHWISLSPFLLSSLCPYLCTASVLLSCTVYALSLCSVLCLSMSCCLSISVLSVIVIRKLRGRYVREWVLRFISEFLVVLWLNCGFF